MAAKIGVFESNGKTYPTIELKTEGAKFGFTFGLSKAQMILENYDEIRQFVIDHRVEEIVEKSTKDGILSAAQGGAQEVSF